MAFKRSADHTRSVHMLCGILIDTALRVGYNHN
jgi:hypothetical protein